MALLIITTILWAFSFSLIGEYLAGSVDSYFSVLMRVGLAALVFLPFLRTRGQSLKTILLYMLVGAMRLGISTLYRAHAALYHADLRPAQQAPPALGISAERGAGSHWRGDNSL